MNRYTLQVKKNITMVHINQISEVTSHLRNHLDKKNVPFHYCGYFFDLIDYLEISIFETAFSGRIDYTELSERWKVGERSVFDILGIFILHTVLSKEETPSGKVIYTIQMFN